MEEALEPTEEWAWQVQQFDREVDRGRHATDFADEATEWAREDEQPLNVMLKDHKGAKVELDQKLRDAGRCVEDVRGSSNGANARARNVESELSVALAMTEARLATLRKT